MNNPRNKKYRPNGVLSAAQALDRMRTGSRLVHMHGGSSAHWLVVPGGAVPDDVAIAIRNDPRIVGQKDGLFPGHDQTWRFQIFAAADHPDFIPTEAPVTALDLLIRLDRSIDCIKPCCNNVATLHPGSAQHAAELRCTECGRHRGWLAREALDFLHKTAARFGVPHEPVILRDTSIGDHMMQKKYENSGILFRNDDKDPSDTRDRDYQGTITVAGIEYWLSGWVKVGKNGKFLGLSAKPKKPAPAEKSKSLDDELDDVIGF